MLERGVLALDEDADGQVTLGDVESTVTRAWNRIQDWSHICHEQFQRPPVRGGVGLIVLFYGGHFKHSVVVLRSLEGGALDHLRSSFTDAINEYRGARERLEARQDGAANGDFVMVPPGPALGRAALAADPRKLLVSLKNLQTTVIAQVAAALNQNTARILVGLEIGRRASEMIGDHVEVLLLGKPPELVVGESGTLAQSEIVAWEEAKEKRMWTRFAIDATCTASGVALGWAMRGWAALWTTCSTGAQLCVEAGMVNSEHQAAFHWVTLLGALGFVYQAQYWGQPPLPGPLWLLIAPARVVEFGLVSLA